MIPLMMLFTFPCFAQQTGYEYEGRLNPSIKKGKLSEVIFINDLAPHLWQQLAIPYKDRFDLDERKKTQGYYNYNTIVDYVSVAVSIVNKGKMVTEKSKTDKLTAAQKRILNSVEDGADIIIDISFRYKIVANDTSTQHIINGQLAVTAVPEREAEFPGGYKQLSVFMREHIFNQLTKPGAMEKVQQSVVKFSIDEEGKIAEIRLSENPGDAVISKLVIETFEQMPRWKPAINTKGVRVKQQFSIPLGMGGC